MKKTILIVASVLALALTSVAKAEISLSAYQEFFAGSADQSKYKGSENHGIDKAGMTDGNYSRITATGSATLDNGIEVNAFYNMARDCAGSDTTNCGVAVNGNGVGFSGGFGAITVGEIFDIGAQMYSRLTAGVPTGEPDGGMLGHFYTGSSEEYGSANETNYAQNDMKIRFNSNSYSGFSFAASYSPNSAQKNVGGGDDGQTNNYVTNKLFNDIMHVAAKYTIDIDGIGFTAAYGQLSGNAGRIGSTDYADLDETVYSIALSYNGFTIDYRKNDAGDSGETKSGQAGGDEGASMCAKYAMGNIGLGACAITTDFVDTSSLSNQAKTRTYSADYKLGGGVTLGVVVFDVEQTANSVVKTDVDGIVSKLSFGF